MPATIAEKVRLIAADLFHLAPEQIGERSSPEQIEAWNSVQHLNLILALEGEFNLYFEPEEIDQMKTIGEVSGMVAAKLGGRSR
jgi:acyl carrier protein